MTLKTRLSLSVVTLVTTVLLAVLTVVIIRESRALLEQASEQRRTNVRQLARLCETTLGLGQEKILLNFLGLWMSSNDVIDVGLWDRAGVLQTHSDFLKGDYSGVQKTDAALANRAMAGGLREIPGAAAGRPTLDMTWPVFEGGKPYGFLRARFDRARLDGERRAIILQTIRQLLWVGLAAEAVGLLVGLTLAWTLTGPIRILSESARSIGAGAFLESVPVHRNDELGALARELERMSGELKRASEFKDSFLRRISHNMRSPLASIESALFHARNAQPDAPTEVLEDYEILQQGTGELTMFINNLLDLERIRRGKMVYRYELCSCDEMIEAAVRLHSRLAQDKELQLSSRIGAGAGDIRADRGIVAQILSNLLLNAIKFTPQGGRVEMAAAADGAGVRLTVSDTGRGLSAKAIKELFHDFVQVEPRTGGGLAGSGIGLAFCKEAAEAMGGRLWVESEIARGSAFHLWLPRARS